MTSDLVERAQRGDHEAFDALAAGAVHRLYAVARRILRDPYAAEDAVQDTLVRAWRDLPALRDRDRFDAWLHRLLVHACSDQDELEHAFLELDVDHRAALVLVHYAGIPAPEAARILGVPTGTIYSRLYYGARRMREVLTSTSDIAIPEQSR